MIEGIALGIFKNPWINVFNPSKVVFDSSNVIKTASYPTLKKKSLIFEEKCVIMKLSRIG